MLLVVEVDVDVELLVDVDVVLVVVSHPLQVLAHCFATKSEAHNFAANRRSHCDKGKMLTFFAHLCSVDVDVDVLVVVVDVLVDVDVDVEVLEEDDVDELLEVLVDVDVELDVDVDVDVVVPHIPSLSASFPGSDGQESSLPQMPSLSASFSGSASHLSKHSASHVHGHTLHIEWATHLPSLPLPLL